MRRAKQKTETQASATEPDPRQTAMFAESEKPKRSIEEALESGETLVGDEARHVARAIEEVVAKEATKHITIINSGADTPKVSDNDIAIGDVACEVTWAEETISPMQFSSFSVGPFSLKFVVREGNSITSTMRERYAALTTMAESIRAEKLKSFLKTHGR